MSPPTQCGVHLNCKVLLEQTRNSGVYWIAFWLILVLCCSRRSYYLRQLILQIILHHQINLNISLKVVLKDRLILISSLVCISDFQGFRYLHENRIFCLNSWPFSGTLLTLWLLMSYIYVYIYIYIYIWSTHS